MKQREKKKKHWSRVPDGKKGVVVVGRPTASIESGINRVHHHATTHKIAHRGINHKTAGEHGARRILQPRTGGNRTQRVICAPPEISNCLDQARPDSSKGGQRLSDPGERGGAG